jgi:hypothetical protein
VHDVPSSAGSAGSNSMSGLSLWHVSKRFREMLVCVSNLFPLVNKQAVMAAAAFTRKTGMDAAHRYLPRNESSNTPYMKGSSSISKPTGNKTLLRAA